jgi:HPt (histidine-containing phosphotransfer) domain-containing protein
MVTNLDYLNELSGGSTEFIKEVSEAFIDETPGNLAKMQSALAVGDYQTIKSIAHKIKPSMTFFGIVELEDEIRDLENNALNQINLDKIPHQIERTVRILNQAIEELKEQV